ncbi:hypothetical protein N7495_009623 [Penicillium taxi]|uniref:uncharacterized protein n=1 Tax=Penicillium taxi TaxID=168475 RepID=UPI00254563A7|nr:uncharacterized protein N7495_009623 [Penicillium taxi]KAJ5885113.1 hypothetical protein N7495_009623 [Penicillium taxi]
MKRFLLVLLCFHLIPSIDSWRSCVWELCEECLPTQIHDAPGIGFDLTFSYGTASVHYYNGTIAEVAKIQAHPEYLQLMMRLKGEHKPKPWYDDKSLYATFLSRLSLSDTTSWGARWRRLNKKLGRPIKARNDVEIISDLLQELKASTEKEISQQIDRVAVTTPDISMNRIVNAALEDLNLRTWVGDSRYYTHSLTEADAVYAANGYGICTYYQDLWDCKTEFEDLPNSQVFTIFYSRHVLYTSITASFSGMAFDSLNSDEAQLFDFEVGLDHFLQTNGSQDSLWSRIRSQLLVLPRKYPYHLTHIFLAGESVTHPRFLALLKDILPELMPISPPTHINFDTNILDYSTISKITDPTFAASRGAALYARRRQEVPGDCTERPECEVRRNLERLNLPLPFKEEL